VVCKSIFPFVVAACSLTLVDASAATAQDADLVAAGKKFAIEVCANCHVVAPDQRVTPLLRRPAPSFRTIVNKPGVTAEGLRSFISTTHAELPDVRKMPNPSLVDYQLDEVIAYMMSLKGRPSK